MKIEYDDNENIRVEIRTKQTISFNQVKSFSQEDWEEFKKKNKKEQIDEITAFLDLSDIHGASDLEGFTARVVDKEDNYISPPDEVIED